MATKLDTRICTKCGNPYIPTGARQRVCWTCKAREASEHLARAEAVAAGVLEPKRFPMRDCPECGEPYIPTGPNGYKRCPTCTKNLERIKAQARYEEDPAYRQARIDHEMARRERRKTEVREILKRATQQGEEGELPS